MNNWSLHRNPKPGQESEAWQAQIARFPHAACHDGVNTLFCDTNELETDAILIERQSEEHPDALAWRLAKYLVQDERPPLHMNGSTWDMLYRHPAYRLFCAKYEDSVELFRSDLDYMANMIGAAMPQVLDPWIEATANITPTDVPGLLVKFIRTYGAES